MTEQATSGDTVRETWQCELGARLHAARAQQRRSKDDIAAQLKLSVMQIDALETGDWSCLPDDVYALGFLRQYGKLLRMNLDEDIQRLKSDISLQQPLTIPDPAIAPSKSWAWAALLLFIGLLVYFALQPGEVVLPWNQTQSPHPSETAVEPASPTPLVEHMAAITTDEDSAKKETEIAAASDVQTSERSNTVVEEAPPVTTDQTTAGDSGKPTMSEHQLLLKAQGGDVWLRINRRNDDGSVGDKLKESLLHNGETMQLSTTENRLLLTAGNAMALQIVVDDQQRYATGSLGQDGLVLRHFVLSLQSDNAEGVSE